MAEPLRYWTFPRAEVERLTLHNPIPAAFLRDWEAARLGVLSDESQDLFATNRRTERQQWTRYDLFERVESISDADFAVCQNWMELFYAGEVEQHCYPLIVAALEATGGIPLVLSWNHDRDGAKAMNLRGLPDNVLVLNYNTSSPTPNDLTVPFWNVDTRLPPNTNVNRRYRASFVGQCGGELRGKLRDTFRNRDGYFIHDTRTDGSMPQAEYLEIMRDSWFAFCPRGGGLSSYRMWEEIQCESVPVLFADDVVLPFSDKIDWSRIIVRIPEKKSADYEAVNNLLDITDKEAMVAECAAIRRQCSMAGCQESIHSRLLEMLK